MSSHEDQRILSLAQEVKFAQALSANDRFMRERALVRLGHWIKKKSNENHEFTEEGLFILLRGIFYCIWMSDKPLIQEETVNNVCKLLHCFKSLEDCLSFFKCFFTSFSQHWFGLDQNRLDKYLMLIRRFLRSIFEVLRETGWENKNLTRFSEDLEKVLLITPVGLLIHVADMYLEELTKVGKGELTPSQVQLFIEPYGKLLAQCSDHRIISAVSQNVFMYLMRQSDEGIKSQMKFNAWKQAGFPGGCIDVMEETPQEPNSDEEPDNDSSEELDPRAGSVHVYLPLLHFDANSVSDFLEKQKSDPETTTKGRKAIKKLVKYFKEFSSGNYPLIPRKVELPEKINMDDLVEEAAERLLDAEENDYQDEPDEVVVSLPKKGKRKRQTSSWIVTDQTSDDKEQKTKKRKLAKSKWEVTTMSNEELETVKKPKVSKGKKIKLNMPNGESKFGSSWDSSSDDELDIPTKPCNGETPVNPVAAQSTNQIKVTPGNGKRVEFVLARNTAQEEIEYKRSLISRPSLPFDANKKPLQGVLKASPIVSPINPFYKKNLRRRSYFI